MSTPFPKPLKLWLIIIHDPSGTREVEHYAKIKPTRVAKELAQGARFEIVDTGKIEGALR